jgi:hypothetical protein
MLRVTRIPLAWAAVACVMLGVRAPRAGAAKSDLSNPKAAIITMGRAMIDDDVKTATDATNVTDEQKPMFEQVVHMTHAMHLMEQAAVKKWGDEGKQVVQAPQRPGQKGAPAGYQDPEQRIKEVEGADVKIEADTATVTPKGDTQKPIICKKVGGDWKVDMSSLRPPGGQGHMAAQMLSAMVKAANETSDEIKADKFKTPTEARSAHQTKIQSAIMEMYQANPGAFQQRGQKGAPKD